MRSMLDQWEKVHANVHSAYSIVSLHKLFLFCDHNDIIVIANT